MNTRWSVRRAPDMPCWGCSRPHLLWCVFNSYGDVDSYYCNWASAVHWAGSPFYRTEFYVNHPNSV